MFVSLCAWLSSGMLHAATAPGCEADLDDHDAKRMRATGNSAGANPACPPPLSPQGHPPPAPGLGHPTPAADSAPRRHTWSGCVRSGVDGTTCARSAVAATVRAAVEPLMGLVPRRVAQRLLSATARQARVSCEGDLHTDTPGESILGGRRAAQVPDEAAKYQDGVTEAIHGMLMHLAETVEALVEELPALVREVSWPPPLPMPARTPVSVCFRQLLSERCLAGAVRCRLCSGQWQLVCACGLAPVIPPTSPWV